MIEILNEKDWVSYLQLLSQLSGFEKPITEENFKSKYNIIKDNSSIIYVIKQEMQIIATARLVIIPKIHDSTCLIEDVVVDKNHRRKGLGKTLIKHILSQASKLGCYKTICMYIT